MISYKGNQQQSLALRGKQSVKPERFKDSVS